MHFRPKSHECQTSAQREFDLKSHDFRPKLHSASVQLPLYYIHLEITQFNQLVFLKAKFWEPKLQNSLHNGFLCISFSCNFIGYFKQTLKSVWLFCFSVPFSWARERERLRAENNAIRELIALLRTNHITRITSDF